MHLDLYLFDDLFTVFVDVIFGILASFLHLIRLDHLKILRDWLIIDWLLNKFLVALHLLEHKCRRQHELKRAGRRVQSYEPVYRASTNGSHTAEIASVDVRFGSAKL